MNEVAQQGEKAFKVQDCALLAISTGRRARDLRELRDVLETVHRESIYYHFWGGLLRPRFDDPEYHNDFAIWAHYGLRDAVLAERLAVIDPVSLNDLEALRHEILEVIEQHLDETEWLGWAKADQQFYFIRAQIVVFDTGQRLESPQDLAAAIPSMSLGSIFFHFIDARRRHPDRRDDFRTWLDANFAGYSELCALLSKVDPFFSSLRELRTRLAGIFEPYCERNDP